MNFDQIIMTSIKLLAVVVLVFVNGFFVAAEFALVKLRRTQLDTLVAKGQRRALMALKLITHLDATLSATQLGITSASLALGWIGEPVFFTILTPLMKGLHVESLRAAHTLSFIIGFSAITFLHIVAGDQKSGPNGALGCAPAPGFLPDFVSVHLADQFGGKLVAATGGTRSG